MESGVESLVHHRSNRSERLEDGELRRIRDLTSESERRGEDLRRGHRIEDEADLLRFLTRDELTGLQTTKLKYKKKESEEYKGEHKE